MNSMKTNRTICWWTRKGFKSQFCDFIQERFVLRLLQYLTWFNLKSTSNWKHYFIEIHVRWFKWEFNPVFQSYLLHFPSISLSRLATVKFSFIFCLTHPSDTLLRRFLQQLDFVLSQITRHLHTRRDACVQKCVLQMTQFSSQKIVTCNIFHSHQRTSMSSNNGTTLCR